VPERVFARHIADVQDKGKELTSTGLLDLAKQLASQAFIRKRQRAARAFASKLKVPHHQNIIHADMAVLWDRLEDNATDLFFSDPPWSNLECYARLAQLAAAKLKPGGLCLCYVGKHYLPCVLDAMRPHLEYWWIFGVRLAGSHYRAHDRGIQNKWTALLAFYKGKRPVLTEDLCDLLVEGGGRQKDLHACQQSPSEAEYLIEKLAKPGGLVVDPYCGSGTIPAAAKRTGRAWLGVEIDPNHVAIARKRLAEQPAGVRS
jgi:site-specific DNA-methyltransferase (adenine-specific)